MRYFLDTEFDEEFDPLQLLSIGVICEDGREFYATVGDSPPHHTCNDWVKKHVVPLLHNELVLDPVKTVYHCDLSKNEIATKLSLWVGKNAQFWGYYATYDWYLLCKMFRSFMSLPNHFPKVCFDLKQLIHHKGLFHSDLPAKFLPEHHALVDARWTMQAYNVLKALPNKKGNYGD